MKIDFFKKATKKRRRIGIVINALNNEIKKSLLRSKKYSDIVVYGTKITGLNYVKSAVSPEKQMIADYKLKKIDQFVRGQADDFRTVDAFKKIFNVPNQSKRVCPAIMEDYTGWQFVLLGASNPDLQNLKDKIDYIDKTLLFLKKFLPVSLKIAVMTVSRPGSYGRNKKFDIIFDEAETLVQYIKKNKIHAENINIEIERAKEMNANVVMPARGIIGNQIYRSVLYLSPGKSIATPTVFSENLYYEDNSRNENDWYNHIIFAQFLANN